MLAENSHIFRHMTLPDRSGQDGDDAPYSLESGSNSSLSNGSTKKVMLLDAGADPSLISGTYT